MQVEIRADKKSMTVGGYVNVVGRDSRVLHDKTGPYVEQIMPGAFKKALAADSKVELRFNHKKILDSVREVSFRPFTELLPKLDRDLVRGAFAGEHFQEYFFANATNEAVAKVVREVLA